MGLEEEKGWREALTRWQSAPWAPPKAVRWAARRKGLQSGEGQTGGVHTVTSPSPTGRPTVSPWWGAAGAASSSPAEGP